MNDKAAEEIVIIYGVHHLKVAVAGRTVEEIRRTLSQPLNLDPGARAVLNGDEAAEDQRLSPGDQLEFVRPSGSKGRKPSSGTSPGTGRRAPVLPGWLGDVGNRYLSRSLHLLVIHGNLYDLVWDDGEFVSFKDSLERWLSQGHSLISFDRSTGPGFSDPEQEKFFREINDYRPGFRDGPSTREAEALTALGEPAQSPSVYERNPTVFLSQMDRFFRHLPPTESRPVALVMEFAETLVPPSDLSTMHEDDRNHLVTFLRWATDDRWKEAGHIMVLLCTNLADVHQQILAQQYGGEALLVPLPDGDLRRKLMEELSREIPMESPAVDAEVLSHLTAGMTLLQISTLWRQASQGLIRLTPEEIRRRKRELFKKELGDLIDIMEPHFRMEDLGGMARIKAFFRQIIDALASGRSLAVPRGMTLMGPPGVGKTALAEAMANEAGFNFVKILNPREKWVGQSERNFWKVLQTIRALTPVVVVEDEADQSESSRDHMTADTGVTSRMRRMRFEFTSDPRLQGQVLWLRITNRPDLLDPADVRSGRSSERIPFFLPEPEELVPIFKAVARRLELPVKKGVSFRKLADLCHTMFPAQLNGADVEEISLRAYRRAAAAGRDRVTGEDYREAILDFLPPHSAEFLRNMELLAATQCSSRQFLPPRFLPLDGPESAHPPEKK
jgi:SpoVK/Ycf46/Vps4 family AAA+-type ATPase